MNKAVLHQLEALTKSVYRVVLTLNENVNYRAGQYIELFLGEENKRPYSIASAPCEQGQIELHLEAREGSDFAQSILQTLKTDKAINIGQAKGDAWFRKESTRDKILIAGGTGFSYVYSILSDWLVSSSECQLTLFWGVKDLAQLYLADDLKKFARENPRFTFKPVLELEHENWQGLSGNVIDAVAGQYGTLADYDVYLGGPFGMSYYAREQFIEKKSAKKEQLFSDAYAFS